MGIGVMLVRSMTEADLPRVVELETGRGPAAWSEQVLRDELGGDNRIYLVAEDGVVVGYAGVMVIGEEAHVTNLLISPERRAQGIGLELMIHLIEAAVDSGARHLTLEVRSKNTAARRLYAKLGLAPVGARPGYYGDDDALILWAHDIDTEPYRERIDGLR